MNVTAVAQPSAASTKNCQGWSPASVPAGLPSADLGAGCRTCLVEVSELIVDALFESGIERRCGGRGVVGLPRPLHGREADGDGAGRTHQVGEQPGEPAETFVDG